jgi:hypothetical protein
MCGRYVRNNIFRPRPLGFACVSTNPYLVGISWGRRLSSFPGVRYNPALLLGHVLGQKGGRWREKSTG